MFVTYAMFPEKAFFVARPGRRCGQYVAAHIMLQYTTRFTYLATIVMHIFTLNELLGQPQPVDETSCNNINCGYQIGVFLSLHLEGFDYPRAQASRVM